MYDCIDCIGDPDTQTSQLLFWRRSQYRITSWEPCLSVWAVSCPIGYDTGWMEIHGRLIAELLSMLYYQLPCLPSRFVSGVNLPADGTEYESGTPAVVSGWGSFYEGGPTPDVLMAVTVPIWTDSGI